MLATRYREYCRAQWTGGPTYDLEKLDCSGSCHRGLQKSRMRRLHFRLAGSSTVKIRFLVGDPQSGQA
jgi:hypothetical protein